MTGSEDTDAVTAAARWLVERGIDVPTDVEAARPTPESTSPALERPETKSGDRTTQPDRMGHERSGRELSAGERTDGERIGDGRTDGERTGDGRTGRRRSDRRAGQPRKDRRAGSGEAAGGSGPEDPVAAARGLVLRKLTAQARTRYELDRALKAKDIPADVADQVLNRMEEVGLVDDTAFARDWVDSRQQRRQLSRQALRHELKHRGVGRDDIEDALATVDGEDEYQAAVALARRKVRTTTGLAREVRYRRLAGALARRGFSSGLTTRVLGEVLDAEPE